MNDSATDQTVGVLVPGGRPVGLVPFLFGVAGRPELPGTVLSRLLTDLGLSTTAARALVARLRTAGQLESVRRGRVADYRLAGELARGFERIRLGGRRVPDAWTGRFHGLLYQVPEEHRTFRDTLRRAALIAGYGMLQQGVLIALANRSDRIHATLAACPPDAWVTAVWLQMTREDAARAALRAWDLTALGQSYQTHVQTLRSALLPGTTPEPTASTLRRFAELSIAPMVDTLRDPGLPTELVPEHWPLAELFTLIGELHARYGPPTRAYAHSLLTSRG